MQYFTHLFDLIHIIAPNSEVWPAAEEQLEQDVVDKGKNYRAMRTGKCCCKL